MNYTVLGDNVNFASRLEGTNRFFGTRILISQSTYEKVTNTYLCRPLGMIAAKGKTVGIAVFELLGRRKTSAQPGLEEFCDQFARGLQAYQRRAWDEALAVFENLLREKPDDAAIQLYQSRCQQYRAQPPAADWQPVEFLETK
jgi:adenylate cyclase